MKTAELIKNYKPPKRLQAKNPNGRPKSKNRKDVFSVRLKSETIELLNMKGINSTKTRKLIENYLDEIAYRRAI